MCAVLSFDEALTNLKWYVYVILFFCFQNLFAIDSEGRVTVNAPLDRNIVNFMTYRLYVQDTRVSPPQEGYGKHISGKVRCYEYIFGQDTTLCVRPVISCCESFQKLISMQPLCMQMHTWTCLHACTHTCLNTHMHVHAHTYIHVCTHAYMCAHACAHTCTHTYIFMQRQGH